jgi:hypothetical protein
VQRHGKTAGRHEKGRPPRVVATVPIMGSAKHTIVSLSGTCTGSTNCRTTRSARERLTKRTAMTGTTGLLGGKRATRTNCATINTPVVHQPTRTTASRGDGTEAKIGGFAGVFGQRRTVAVPSLRVDAEEVSGSNPLSPTTLRVSSNYLVPISPFESSRKEVCTWRLLGYLTARS